MTNQGPGEPDETQPFTHRPYGDRGDDPSFVSPSGPDQQPDTPAWPTYGQPSTPTPEPPTTPGPPAPPSYAPPPQAQNPYLQQPYGQAPYGPPPGFGGYGQPVPGYHYAQPLGAATTSMVLGIIGLVSILATPFCCITLPGMIVAPFALFSGISAKRQIDRNPGAYSNRGQAVAGFVMGIVGTVLAVLVIVVVVAFVGMTDWSSSYDGY